MEYNSIGELVSLAEKRDLPISEIIIDLESTESKKSRGKLIAEMSQRLVVMKEAVAKGRKGNLKSESGLTGGEAAAVKNSDSPLTGKLQKQVIVNALAVSEVNACMGKIVAGPTAGASGIVPAVLLTLQEEYDFSDERICCTLFTAAGLGNVIDHKATLSGAAGGCQAECGAASAMAAGAAAELMGGTPGMTAHAFALALKNLLGLVCDPVAGLVEVPCVKRNAFAATHALTAVTLALSGIKSVIPPDEVVEAMAEVGSLLPDSLKETSGAGLATTKTGKKISKKLTGSEEL